MIRCIFPSLKPILDLDHTNQKRGRRKLMSSMELIVLLILLFVPFFSAAHMLHRCSETLGNYTADSPYKANLDKLLLQVASNTQLIDNGFYNFSVGREPNQVNAVVLCRGDLTISDCRTCLNSAVLQIKETCANEKAAVLWDDTCMLRYTNRSTFGIMDEDPGSYSCDAVNASDPSLFWTVADGLLANLQNQASKGDYRRKFATGEANVTHTIKVYGLIQCTPDLSELDCFNCLHSTIGFLQKYCFGMQGGRDVEPSCNVMFGISRFYGLVDAAPPPLLPSPPIVVLPLPSRNSGKENGSFKVIIVVISAIAFVQFIILVVCLLNWGKRRGQRNSRRLQIEGGDNGSSTEALQYDFSVVRVATMNFSEDNKLGRGGFGSVYKGILSNGQQIAVKRLAIANSGQGELEFKNEVMLVAKLQHRNLVRLHGFSLEDEERLLIYELVPNASLDYFLFDETRLIQLDWEKRCKIIGGITRGVLYLHEDSRLRIIHRDLKASNILLDANMNPKISDFGVARHVHVDETQDTHRIVGTFGYMAPEYALRGSFSTKSDVYSFGVLVLEILTGRKCLTFSIGEASEHLISMIWRGWIEGRAIDIVDPTILVAGIEAEILRYIQIGLLCVQDDAANRPTMSEVDIMLRSHFFALPMPSKPTYATNGIMKVPQRSAECSSRATNRTTQSNS